MFGIAFKRDLQNKKYFCLLDSENDLMRSCCQQTTSANHNVIPVNQLFQTKAIQVKSQLRQRNRWEEHFLKSNSQFETHAFAVNFWKISDNLFCFNSKQTDHLRNVSLQKTSISLKWQMPSSLLFSNKRIQPPFKICWQKHNAGLKQIAKWQHWTLPQQWEDFLNHAQIF